MRTAFLLVVFVLSVVHPSGLAQQLPQGPLAPSDGVLAVTASVDEGYRRVTLGGTEQVAQFTYAFRDESIQGSQESTAFTDVHTVALRFEGWVWPTNPSGWIVTFTEPKPSQIDPGRSGYGDFTVVHEPSVRDKFVEGALKLTLTSTRFYHNETVRKNVSVLLGFAVEIRPEPNAELLRLSETSPVVGPDEFVEVRVRIRNTDFYGDVFRLSAVAEPKDPGSPILGEGTYYLGPGESRNVSLGFRTPRENYWPYGGSQGLAMVSVSPARGGPVQTVVFLYSLEGPYVSEQIWLLLFAFLAALALLIWLLVFIKHAYDRYLGKPLPPWQIPEESVRLEQLKRENPQAHYVLRYYLMEEEYRSSLLWFYAYKKVSKKQLKKEMRELERQDLVAELAAPSFERFDKDFQRVERRFLHRIERRKAWVQRKVAGLQEKLEANFERDHERDREAWEKRVDKVKGKQLKPFRKEQARWEKETARLLAQWEKPFKRQKAKYEKQLEAAKEAYAKKVKKVDKPTWRLWRDAVADWEEEVRTRAKEGRELPPEPALRSEAAGPPELPTPIEYPPKPALPPEPTAPLLRDLPPEPAREKPLLASSHYARKARKFERKGQRKVRKLERKMAKALEAVNEDRRAAERRSKVQRAKVVASVESAQGPSWLDRTLKRTPEAIEARHQRSYLNALRDQRIKEARAHEAAHVELVRLQAQRREAELEADVIRERAAAHRASRVGSDEEKATETGRLAEMSQRLADLRAQNKAKLSEEEAASEVRLQAKTDAIRKDFEKRIAAQARSGPAPPREESPAES